MNEVVPDLAPGTGSQRSQSTQGTQGTQAPGSASAQNQEREADRKKDRALRPGQKIKLPTDQGDEQEFRVTNRRGREVEIENPDGDPATPNKFVYDKDQLKKGMKSDDENS